MNFYGVFFASSFLSIFLSKFYHQKFEFSSFTCIIIELRPEKTCFLHIYICEHKVADHLHGNRAADQRLCFRYRDSTIPLLL